MNLNTHCGAGHLSVRDAGHLSYIVTLYRTDLRPLVVWKEKTLTILVLDVEKAASWREKRLVTLGPLGHDFSTALL